MTFRSIFIQILLILYLPTYGQDLFDTIIISNNLSIEFSKTDSVDFPDYFDDQKAIDLISKQYGNWHERAIAVEKYQIQLHNLNIIIDSLARIVTLDNGEKLRLTPNITHDEYGYTFEKEFKDNGFLLFRVQWFEGNNYFLLNTMSGEKTYIGGRAYFSPNGKYLIGIEDDIEALYSFNGFQLYSVEKNGHLKLIWQFSPVWGPYKIKWIDNSSLVTKGYYLNDNWEKVSFFKSIKINMR